MISRDGCGTLDIGVAVLVFDSADVDPEQAIAPSDALFDLVIHELTLWRFARRSERR